MTTTATMTGVFLPGNSTVEFKDVSVPVPGHGQVLIRMKASSICGSDIRAIYREHLGKGPEGYQGVIAGHEPCGQIVKVGPGCKEFKAGDRVSHGLFGEGIVLKVEPALDDEEVTVAFPGKGTKTLLASFAKLRKVG